MKLSSTMTLLDFYLPASEQYIGWASEASLTLGCSIDILRDICNWACEASPPHRDVQLRFRVIGRAKRAPHQGVQSRFRVI